MDSKSIFLLVIGAIIGQIVILLFSSIKKYLSSSETDSCVFKHPEVSENRVVHSIIIKKRFKKIVSINCGWHKILINEGYQGYKYPYCPMAKISKDASEPGKCQFY